MVDPTLTIAPFTPVCSAGCCQCPTPTSNLSHGEHAEHGEPFAVFESKLEGLNVKIFTLVFFMMFVSLTRVLFHRFHLGRIIPESAVTIVLGFVFGLVIHIIERSLLSFDHEMFFMLLIPPIIWEAGYHVRRDFFFRNIGLITTYAILGTLFNSFGIGVVLFLVREAYIGEALSHINFVDCLSFGALIAAVDPVAVLAVFEKTGVHETLNILVFGESVLNDAVSIVLFHLFRSIAHTHVLRAFSLLANTGWLLQGDFSVALPFLAVAKFFFSFFGGMAIGVVCGLLGALIAKHTGEMQILAPVFMVLTAFMSFNLAEVVGFSGIVAILFCGMVQHRYCRPNIGEKGSLVVRHIAKIAAGTCEHIVFLYLGMYLAFMVVDGEVKNTSWFTLICLACTLIFRFLGVFGLTAIGNLTRMAPDKISMKDQVVLAYGGLRGGIAFALSLTLDSAHIQDHIVTATLFVCIFTIFVQGSTIKPLLNLLKSKKKQAPSVSTTVLKRLLVPMQAAGKAIVGSWSLFQVLRLDKADRFVQRLVVRDRMGIPENVELVGALNSLQKEMAREKLQYERDHPEDDGEMVHGPETVLRDGERCTTCGALRERELLEERVRELLSSSTQRPGARGSMAFAVPSQGRNQGELDEQLLSVHHRMDVDGEIDDLLGVAAVGREHLLLAVPPGATLDEDEDEEVVYSRQRGGLHHR